MLLLVPSDPVNPRRVDEHFAPEASAAVELGAQVSVVNLEALSAGDADTAAQRVGPSDDAVYRGWMVTAHAYEQLVAALQRRDCVLRTSPAAFRTAHELPGWAAALAPHTPTAEWTTSPAVSELIELCGSMAPGAGVLRDYVKSMKHYWHEAAFIPDLADPDAVRSIGQRFVELRGDAFNGGFVVRRFEEFVGPEVRTWWADGVLALTTAHPDSPEELPHQFEMPAGVSGAVAGLGLPFVTVDFVRRRDGVWRIVELGDGQVSDRPRSTPPEGLVAALWSGRSL
ncbi:MAG: ATP-grasp domain-containing protein [Ilumatobacteraceae bacterium]